MHSHNIIRHYIRYVIAHISPGTHNTTQELAFIYINAISSCGRPQRDVFLFLTLLTLLGHVLNEIRIGCDKKSDTSRDARDYRFSGENFELK